MPLALQEAWQFGVLAAATLLLLAVRRGGVAAVLLAAAMGSQAPDSAHHFPQPPSDSWPRHRCLARREARYPTACAAVSRASYNLRHSARDFVEVSTSGACARSAPTVESLRSMCLNGS